MDSLDLPANSLAATMPAISHWTWEEKYRFKALDGTPIDITVEDTLRRTAKALAAVEADPVRAEAAFYEALHAFLLLPGGRILAGAGTNRAVTLANCFVMGTIPDDLGGIFTHLREAALTMQQGGGIGYDFSTLRPKGAPVLGVGADASGPLSFMDVWDAMCRTILSAGTRRGAMMATLRCDHPDIEAFIEAKRDPTRLRMFNLSVLATDAFMAAIAADGDWELRFGGTVYKVLKARALWDKIMRATYDYAEPGVLFIDRINRRNNLRYCETICAPNPCGELPLPPYGACVLGSINLAGLVLDPFTPNARLDIERLKRVAATGVRLLDDTIEISKFPLPAQQVEAAAKRRIGLGITGLADALVMCGLTYGTEEAAERAEEWMCELSHAAYMASIELARERGAFPALDREQFLAGEMIWRDDEQIRQGILEHGIRHALLTTVAPTGTTSLFALNVSSGIEPIFAPSYTRYVTQADGTKVAVGEVTDYAVALYRRLFGRDAPLPATFVTAQDLPPEAHIRMQAAIQKWIDNSIAKTINLPREISFKDFNAVYSLAYTEGCKGCTTYRPNDITGSVLEVRPSAALAAPSAPASDLIARPEAVPGRTYKLVWPESEHALYVTINDVIHDGRKRPIEIFVNSKSMDHYAWVVGLTRMISAVFRRGGDVAFIAEELQAVFDPRGGHWHKGKYVPSLVAALGHVLEQHMRAIGFIAAEPVAAAAPAIAISAAPALRAKDFCPKCQQPALRHQSGCVQCDQCGWSSCG